jgi:hypothetical protein
MNLQGIIIDRLASFLMGSDAWGKIQATVHILESESITGHDKRVAALEMIGRIGLGIAGFLINLGIELAVAKIRTAK